MPTNFSEYSIRYFKTLTKLDLSDGIMVKVHTVSEIEQDDNKGIIE